MEPEETSTFCSALVYALQALGDDEAAGMAQERFREHEFVLEDGSMHLGLWPRVVRDVTGGRFSGRLTMSLPDDLVAFVSLVYNGGSARALAALNEDIRAGRVMQYAGAFAYSQPVIHAVNIDGNLYAVLELCNLPGGATRFIFDGEEYTWSRERLDIKAVLELQREGEELATGIDAKFLN